MSSFHHVEVELCLSKQILTRHDAEDAIDGLDGRKYDGRELSVQYARSEFSVTMRIAHMRTDNLH